MTAAESIELAEPRTARLGPRAVAALLDLLLVLLAVGLPLAAASGQLFRDDPTISEGWNVGFSLTLGQDLVVLVALVAYATVAEALFGATLGKRLFGLRVRRGDGSPIGWREAIARNVLRVVDAFPWFVPYVFGWVVALADRGGRRRVGDRLAGTQVLRTR